jgi:hypothetical protein
MNRAAQTPRRHARHDEGMKFNIIALEVAAAQPQ